MRIIIIIIYKFFAVDQYAINKRMNRIRIMRKQKQKPKKKRIESPQKRVYAYTE